MKRYEGIKVLVTGGTGFIGSRAAERLALEEGADVTALVNTWCHAASVSRSNIKLLKGDITAASSVSEAVKGCDMVFHCVGVGGSKEHCRKVNVGGTKNVLDACERHGVKRIVYLSTIGVHGPSLTEGMDETAPYRPSGWPYADSKIEAEKIFLEFLINSNVEGTVIRPTYVWGPGSSWFTLYPVMQILQDRFCLVNQGSGACNAVHVDNVVDLMLSAALNEAAAGECFHIRDDSRRTWKEFFSFYARMAGKDIDSFPSVSSDLSGLKKGILKLKDALKSPAIPVDFLYGWAARTFPEPRYRPLRGVFFVSLIFLSKWGGLLDRLIWEPHSQWDLKKFTSPGFISIEKIRNLLGYTPRISIEAGMKQCELWMIDQNYLPPKTQKTL